MRDSLWVHFGTLYLVPWDGVLGMSNSGGKRYLALG